MARILFAPVGIAGGLLAGMIARKAFELAWARVDDDDPPSPEQEDARWPRLIAALALEGATFAVVRGSVDHATRRYFRSATGTWPGSDDEDEDD